ncbi:MAG TPA: oxidoreductase, partial [Leptospiraceae bacterium]|nr:oxidoreductase [Leptospiraceae bacterium]
MSGKIRVGIIGVGHMGQYHVNVAAGINQYELAGIFDADPARREEIGGRFQVPTFETYDDLIDHSDAVVIAVPTAFHYEVAKKALEKGRHVLVEKPITETVEQARELVSLAA